MKEVLLFMDQFERAFDACEYIKKRISFTPEIAIVLGSGLGKAADKIQDRIEISYEAIPDFPVSTVPGHAGKFIAGVLGGRKIIAMQGRFHLYEGYNTDDVILPVRVFKLLGVKSILLTNAAGAINTSFNVGQLMIIND